MLSLSISLLPSSISLSSHLGHLNNTRHVYLFQDQNYTTHGTRQPPPLKLSIAPEQPTSTAIPLTNWSHDPHDTVIYSADFSFTGQITGGGVEQTTQTKKPGLSLLLLHYHHLSPRISHRRVFFFSDLHQPCYFGQKKLFFLFSFHLKSTFQRGDFSLAPPTLFSPRVPSATSSIGYEFPRLRVPSATSSIGYEFRRPRVPSTTNFVGYKFRRPRVPSATNSLGYEFHRLRVPSATSSIGAEDTARTESRVRVAVRAALSFCWICPV